MTAQAATSTTAATVLPILHTPGGPSGGGSIATRSPYSSTTPINSPSQNPSPGSPRLQSGAVDVEALIRSHGGDLRRTLDTIVAERNSLQAQNTSLWKLIERQRIHCATLTADKERLRAERDRANKSLVSAGLEPVPRRGVPHSASAMTLSNSTPEPLSRRQNSDHDDKASTLSHSGTSNHTITTTPPTTISAPPPSTSTSASTPAAPASASSLNSPLASSPPTTAPSVPNSATATVSSASTPREQLPSTAEEPPSSPTSSLAPSALPATDSPKASGLLPSPMPERRLRHESRMTFPPEVASFMALADPPSKDQPTSTSLPASASLGSELNTNTTTPPFTSSPGDSGRASPIPEQTEEHEEHLLLDSNEPRPSQDTVTSRPSLSTNATSAAVNDVGPRPSVDSVAMASIPSQSSAAPDHTYLAPALLPHARLSIPYTTVFPNSSGREVLCFIVSVNVRPPNSTPLSWTVGKTFSAFVDLDARTLDRSGKSRKEWKRMVASLPDGKAWKDLVPSKVDQRKAALETYLDQLLVAPISDKSDLCNFLSSDVVQAKTNKTRQEGYLTKKGKTLGGWKTRYFILDGPIMKYYESRGGPILGSIQIAGAQIGRQNRAPDATDDRNFRHAFLIIEANGKKDSNRHVLCASSDADRDSWIDMLVRQVEPEQIPTAPLQPTQSVQQQQVQQAQTTTGQQHAHPQGHHPREGSALSQRDVSAARELGHQRRRSAIRKASKDVVITAAQPLSSLPDANAKFMSGAPLPSVINHMEKQRQHHSGGQSQTGGAGHPLGLVTSVTSTTDLLNPNEPTSKVAKRQSAMPGRQSFSPAYLTKLSSDGISSVPGYNMDRDRDRKAKSGRFWGFGSKSQDKGPARPVFGVPLADSIAVASVAGLPAIVFRCIEYLESKRADQEEGIYRLSGSSAVIKGLKDRFNHEGDVNLLALDERWDPHAIAGLLKTYLRELPTSLLTRELQMRFLAVIDLIDSSARVAELQHLVSELPPANYALLRAFTSHLILIVRNSSVNKMTLRNIGIVFSPTLGIPAGIFYELVSRFGAIFDDEGVDELPLDDPAAGTTAPLGVSPTDNSAADAPASKRNSMLYHAGGTDAMLGLAGRALDPAAEDDNSEMSIDDAESEPMSAQSSDNVSLATGPGPSPSDSSQRAAAAGRMRDPSRSEGDVEALAPHNGQL